jgi:hypothetical protein
MQLLYTWCLKFIDWKARSGIELEQSGNEGFPSRPQLMNKPEGHQA